MRWSITIAALTLCVITLAQHHPSTNVTTKAALSTGYAPHPSGSKLIVRQGTNEIVCTRRQCKSRMNQILFQIQGLQEQLEIGRRFVRDYPPLISKLVHEMEENRLHISIMDSMGLNDEPSQPPVPPPSPPGADPLPLNPGSGSGLPASLRVN